MMLRENSFINLRSVLNILYNYKRIIGEINGICGHQREVRKGL
jgi:hypothetical protein